MSATRRELVATIVSFMLFVTAAATIVPAPTAEPEPPIPKGFDVADNPSLGERPLLVVLLEFSDLPADVSASYIQNQIYGPRPSMNDYYLETSYGEFWFRNEGHFTWITAWDDPGTPDDESTRAYWNAFGATDPYHGGTMLMHALISLDKAGFDFSPFDSDTDGDIEMGKELAYLMVDSQDPDKRGGATRGMPDKTIDGKLVTGRGCGVSEDSPWITLYAHELGHQTLFLPDYYGIQPQNIGLFSLMGYSGFTNASGSWWQPIGPHHLDPYSKLKLGWEPGTVVSSDGFFEIDDSETNDEFFILHDSAHGKKEYFLVENKWRGSSYDHTSLLIPAMTPPLPPAAKAADIPDQGLLIWHVDEDRDWNGTATGGFPKVNLTRRINDDSKAAFNGDDAGYYDFWDGSAPQNAKWNDGTNSKTGVWCVGDAGSTVRAWLDVPGPGILPCSVVDSASAVPGNPATFEVELVNTGDATDTFMLYFVGLDSDLTQVLPAPLTLSSKSPTSATVDIVPKKECTTTPGTRTLTLRVQSTTNPLIYTDTEVTLEVLTFGDPQATIAPSYLETDPNATVAFTVQITNGGNTDDTFNPQFFAVDFGSTYMASPSAIPDTWVTFSPTGPSAPACGVTTTIMSITVPWDWAGMEDALYDFWVEVWSTISPVQDSAYGQLMVHATPLSMMLWVKAEIEQLIADVEALPDSDVKDGLHDKAVSALNKTLQGINRYGEGDDPPASNHFRTTQNKLKAFIHLLHAQSGKALTVIQAADFEAQVNAIIEHLDMILAEI